jgi:hypothetical protein
MRKLVPFVAAMGIVLALMFWLSREGERVSETPLRVAEVTAAGEGLWSLPAGAVGQGGQPFVARLVHLRAQRVPVETAGPGQGGGVLVRASALKAGDLVVVGPEGVAEGEAVAVMSGVREERVVAAVIEAGMAAVAAENLPEAVRYVSPGYRDPWGYNIALLRAFLKKAFQEFERPEFQLAAPLSVRVEGQEALAQADVRLLATYHGRRNYLLGGDQAPNRVMVRLKKGVYGWKIARLEGLQPLGFQERYFRLLGGEIGMPLTDEERREREAACGQCRQRMIERFGAAPGSEASP